MAGGTSTMGSTAKLRQPETLAEAREHLLKAERNSRPTVTRWGEMMI